MDQTVDETMLPRRRANESQPSRSDIFLTGRVVSLLRGTGAWQGSRWSAARPEARGGRCRKVRGGWGQKEARESAGDECVFIPGGGSGWQIRSGETPYRPGRAVRGSRGR
jgi:hypothetical protein